MIKFFQKGDYYLPLMRVAHFSFVRVEITCAVDEKQLSSESTFLSARKKKLKWLTLTEKETQRNIRKKLSRTYLLIMCIFSLFHFVASIKIWPHLDCKYAWPAFLFYLWLYLNKRNHIQPYIRAPHQIYLVSEVLEFAINPLLHYLSGSISIAGFFLRSVSNGLCFKRKI